MANQEHLDILKRGVEQWNEWRKQHPGTWSGPRGANLSRANLTGTNLHGAHLRFANLNNADMRFTTLSNANLSCARLSATSLLKADLREAYLYGADLSRADLRAADLRGTYLHSADLDNANLSDADLHKADLRRAHLEHATLSGAKLSNTNLNNANLSSANLSEANLSGATLSWTIVADIDLRTAKGLVEINHQGPSHLELRTIQFPQDGSALHFLRGCGMPDEWIDFYRSMMMRPIQYHSCFISYSSKDETLARRLHADLQDRGVRCWFVPEDMKIGDKIRARIDEAIHLQDKLLLILSAASVASDWVEHEVEMALAKERKEKRPVLFPIRVDCAILDQEDHGWPALVRHERHIGDFTSWTVLQEYQQAFERLLRDLKAGQPF